MLAIFLIILACMAIGHVFLYFHVKIYKTLLNSIESREGEVWSRRDYPGIRITSTLMAMPHIKKIQKKYCGNLTNFEIESIRKAKRLYVIGTIICFSFVPLILLFLSLQ